MTTEPYVDTFTEEIGQTATELLGDAIRSHRAAGGAVDGALLAKMRGAVHDVLREHVPARLANLTGQRQLVASGDLHAELEKKWSGLRPRIR